MFNGALQSILSTLMRGILDGSSLLVPKGLKSGTIGLSKSYSSQRPPSTDPASAESSMKGGAGAQCVVNTFVEKHFSVGPRRGSRASDVSPSPAPSPAPSYRFTTAATSNAMTGTSGSSPVGQNSVRLPHAVHDRSSHSPPSLVPAVVAPSASARVSPAPAETSRAADAGTGGVDADEGASDAGAPAGE